MERLQFTLNKNWIKPCSPFALRIPMHMKGVQDPIHYEKVLVISFATCGHLNMNGSFYPWHLSAQLLLVPTEITHLRYSFHSQLWENETIHASICIIFCNIATLIPLWKSAPRETFLQVLFLLSDCKKCIASSLPTRCRFG